MNYVGFLLLPRGASIPATPYTAALASYYTFDNMDWDATYYEDKVNNASHPTMLSGEL